MLIGLLTTHKSYFFYLLLIMISIYACKHNNKHTLIYFMIFVIFVSYISLNFFDNAFIGSLIYRRAYLSSAQAVYLYYNFFSINDFIFWSNSVMSSFINYPYEGQYNKIVYNFFFDKNSGNNTSFFTIGYMHAGFLGVALYCFIYKLLINYLDALQEQFMIPTWCIVTINFIPFYILINFSDLTVSLLSHGLLLSLILTYLLIPVIRKALQRN